MQDELSKLELESQDVQLDDEGPEQVLHVGWQFKQVKLFWNLLGGQMHESFRRVNVVLHEVQVLGPEHDRHGGVQSMQVFEDL